VKYGLSVGFFEHKYVVANIINVILKINNLSSMLSIYRLPSGSMHEFFTTLSIIIITLDCYNGRVIIIRDINLNIIGVDNVDNEYLDFLSEN